MSRIVTSAGGEISHRYFGKDACRVYYGINRSMVTYFGSLSQEHVASLSKQFPEFEVVRDVNRGNDPLTRFKIPNTFGECGARVPPEELMHKLAAMLVLIHISEHGEKYNG